MTTDTATKPYDELMGLVGEASLLGSSASILGWDQETMMPSAGVEFRARQLSQLAGMVHRMATDPRIGELLDACEADADLVSDPASDSASNLREIRHSYDRATKLPGQLVTEWAQARSVATHEWQEARKEDNYERFRPWLEKNLSFARQAAEHYGWPSDGEPWDALADAYEPGMTAAQVESVFVPLRDRLQGLLDALTGGSKRPSEAVQGLELPVDAQRSFVRSVAEAIGFDFDRGRLDESAHPFCGGSNPNDVRMTTRYRPDGLFDALYATMHESGHGIYEQGLPLEHVNAPIGNAASLGIHESQSRLWENQVGRSEAFWQWCFPRFRDHFGDAVSHLSERDVFEGSNTVEPGLIRVEADEATYNMHIMIRFELERLLMNGDLDPADLPDAWNARYDEYLGVKVPDHANGCMQDIHWAGGAFGYFPTYTLGNLYCAQIFATAGEQIGNLQDRIADGDFAPLKQWLNDNVHAHGRRFRSAELCERITGRPLEADPLLAHLETKLKPLYGA